MNMKRIAFVCAALAGVLSASADTAAGVDVPPPRPSTAEAVAATAEAVSEGASDVAGTLTLVADTASGVAEGIERRSGSAAARAKALAAMSSNPVTRTGLAAMGEQTFSQGMGRAADIRLAAEAVGTVGTVASAVSYAASGVEIAGQVASGNYGEAGAMAAQLATEEAVARVGTKAATALCGPGCGAVYGATNAAGSLVKKIDTCAFRDCGPDGTYTIEDGVTDVYFGAYEKVTFALDPSSDPMSEEFAAKVRAQVEQNKRDYQQRAEELRAQQELLDQQRVASVATPMTAGGTASESDGGVADFVSAIVNGVSQYHQLRSTQGSSSSATAESNGGSSNMTGCHPGHDEQAHPGGCLSAPLH